jgi:hypothetical protein
MLTALLWAPAVLGAQRTAADSAALDSLAARLARAEAAIALLRQQLAAEAATAVTTRSRFQLELNARVQTNAYVNDRRVNNVDVPQFVLADTPAPPGGDNSAGASLRQSTLGVAAVIHDVLGATFEGDLDLDFYGGVQNGPGDRRLFPEPRLRTARARLRWSRTEVMVGSETPLVSDLNPVSVAAVAVPGFVTAGNLWNWLPQLRVTRELGGRRVRWAVQGALLEPFAGDQAVGEPDAVDAGDRAARPSLEGRLRARWGGGTSAAPDDGDVPTARGGELAISAHRGWVAVGPEPVGSTGGRRLLASHALAMDAHVFFGRLVELRAEAYRGQLLRGLGGGAIGQTFGRAAEGATLGPVIRDVAGWAQLNVHPSTTVVSGVGCGVNVARTADRPIRRRNTVCAAHALWRPAQPIVVGLEYRRLRTRYETAAYSGGHLNLTLGFEL